MKLSTSFATLINPISSTMHYQNLVPHGFIRCLAVDSDEATSQRFTRDDVMRMKKQVSPASSKSRSKLAASYGQRNTSRMSADFSSTGIDIPRGYEIAFQANSSQLLVDAVTTTCPAVIKESAMDRVVRISKATSRCSRRSSSTKILRRRPNSKM
jgi:N-acyl-D-aspartate/D-glutamate deacylase